MKTEINLRTREFVKSREFYWPRVIITLLTIVVLTTVIVGAVFAYLYHYSLHNELAYLTGRQDELQTRVAPIEQMEAEISAVQSRAALFEDLSQTVTIWSDYLQVIERTTGLWTSADQITVAGDGTTVIKGRGRSMEGIAVYVQDLNRLDFVSRASFAYLNYEQGDFSFTLGATIITGGGQDNGGTAEQETAD